MANQKQLKEAERLQDEYPAGALVWHRADNSRGVVLGWNMFADGSVGVRVDWGARGNSNEMNTSLSSSPVSSAHDDGESWKA